MKGLGLLSNLSNPCGRPQTQTFQNGVQMPCQFWLYQSSPLLLNSLVRFDLSFDLTEIAHQSCPKTVWMIFFLPFQTCQGAHIGVADHSNGHMLLVLARNQTHSNQTEKVMSRTSRMVNTFSRTTRSQIEASLEERCHEMNRGPREQHVATCVATAGARSFSVDPVLTRC